MKVCSIEGCSKKVFCRGMCSTHYTRWQRHGDPFYTKTKKIRGEICSIEGCLNPVLCRGLCNTHYLRWQRHGDPFYRKTQKLGTKKCKHPGCKKLNEIGEYCVKHYQRYKKYGRTDDSVLKNLKSVSPKKRIWLCSELDLETGCWIWQKGKSKDGYGQFSFKNRNYRAHWVAYRLYVGPIPRGMLVLHRCDSPACVNPKHLFLGDNATNMADMVQKNRQVKGIDHLESKLTEDQVREIKKRLAGPETISDIARDYPVDRKVVSRIKAGTNWKPIKI